MKVFERWKSQGFQWLPMHGVGFFPVNPNEEPYYGGDPALKYWQEYQRRDDSRIGVQLNEFRVSFVEKVLPEGELLLDVGIGAGAFLRAWHARGHKAVGTDVNPHGIDYLKQMGWLYLNKDKSKIRAATFWDVFEHLEDPNSYLRDLDYVFMSIPIFTSAAHAMASKHFKPKEHRWYFTVPGLLEFMVEHGFRVEATSLREAEIGREDVQSFAFVRSQ